MSEDAARNAAQYRADRDAGGPTAYDPDDADRQVAEFEQAEREKALAERRRRDRAATKHLWVERQIQQAMERGEFDDLPLAGRPIPGIDSRDPDWWVKNLIEREQITGVAPEAIQLRKDDAVLDARLDELFTADEVRAALDEFNARVVAARRQLTGGPPVVTPLRDVEHEVAAWRARRAARVARAKGPGDAAGPTAPGAPGEARARRRWWRRA
ncbi:uncharacterized protein DUF1992 [Sediminihabitans luteus]|uniref:Uncharacterized protein DUF1992 n=1 Tax=Sediminihabitans luteus TaxID=1138585 RepID=A0A2M9D120_9CELL|nr:DUF1992 domain-containing protein [Sediminihabitans luteus]PJJ77869.1 uncharacterized protein DUF1992 [Sediminihabitans luteus]GII99773.1 hypothetical protein Slu03_21510 [Sediminihabitans luteus]